MEERERGAPSLLLNSPSLLWDDSARMTTVGNEQIIYGGYGLSFSLGAEIPARISRNLDNDLSFEFCSLRPITCRFTRFGPEEDEDAQDIKQAIDG